MPRVGRDELGVDFLFPEDLKRLSLGVVIEARHPHEGRVITARRRDDFFDKVLSLPNADYLGCLRQFSHHCDTMRHQE